jgi:hypothetical protein
MVPGFPDTEAIEDKMKSGEDPHKVGFSSMFVIQAWNNRDKIRFGYSHTSRSTLMRHVVGFTKTITKQPFHIVEDQSLQFSVGQFVKIAPSDDWLQIYQVGTQVYVDRLYMTVIVGDPLPGGSLSKGENWSAAVDWTKSYPQ